MSKFTEGVKNWGNNHPRTIRFGKAFAKVLAKGIVETANVHLEHPAVVIPGEAETLSAEQISELTYLSTSQLKAIFAGRNVRFSTDKDSLEALNYLSTSQINAILGKE